MEQQKSIKDTVMEKKNPKPVELESSALGLSKNHKEGMWTLVKITYNVETLDVGKVEILAKEQDRSTAIERFKIAAAELDLVG